MNKQREETHSRVTFFRTGAFGVSAVFCKDLEILEEELRDGSRRFTLKFLQPRKRKRRGTLVDAKDLWVISGDMGGLVPPVFETNPRDPCIEDSRYTCFSPEWRKEFEANLEAALAGGAIEPESVIVNAGEWTTPAAQEVK
tara:strand:+ start:1500 stop:1922 length:423 start_codon:yes stop_codon:yes gene_type:complete